MEKNQKFLADYHTHTIYSRKPFWLFHHGKGTIEDNVKQAAALGFSEVAITDHGFNHKFFGTTRRRLPQLKAECKRLSELYNINVLLGVEANILGIGGEIDIRPSDMQYLDIVLCGFHEVVRAKSIKDKFRFFYANFLYNFFKKGNKRKALNSLAFTNAIKNNSIDIITHLNSKMRLDVLEVAKVAKECGTLVEINTKHTDITDDEFKMLAENEVPMIVSSDAHSPKRIGDFDKAINIINKNNLPEKLICNLNKLPNFKNYKRK